MKTYQRLAAVFDAAVIDGLRPDNPATPIRRELHKPAGRRRRDNFPSMPYQQVAAFAKRLRAAAGNSPRCLEFAILSAARTSEALTAQWAEFDRQARTWTIPAAKMKCRERHVVHLNDRAAEILDGQAGQSATYVFPSPRSAEAPMSNMSLLMTLRRLGVKAVTVHGFRSTFSTWANELGIAKPDAIEAALAHRQQNAAVSGTPLRCMRPGFRPASVSNVRCASLPSMASPLPTTFPRPRPRGIVHRRPHLRRILCTGNPLNGFERQALPAAVP